MECIKGKRRMTKSDRALAEILRQIQLGNYPRGTQFPSEAELSSNFAISHMTVRKIIGQLVEENYLFRVPRVGTFVCDNIPEHQLQKQLALIMPAWPAPEYNDFLWHISRIAEDGNWLLRFVFSRHWEDRAILDAWENSDALLIIAPDAIPNLPESLAERFRDRRKPVVFIGTPVIHLGFDCVCGSQENEMNYAIDALLSAGHRRIAYIGQREVHESQRQYQDATFYSTWQSRMQVMHGKDWKCLDLSVSCPTQQLPHQAMYDRIRETVLMKKYTAVIAEMPQVHAVTAALIDSGVTFPGECSLIAIGDRMEVPFYRPEPARVVVPHQEHARLAFELVKYRTEYPELPPQQREVHPLFAEGQTLSQNPQGE